jgi:hypothetical protein
MNRLKDYFGLIIAFAAVVGSVLGALSYFATAEDLQLVQVRLEQKIVADQQFTVQQQIWALEERNLKHGADCSRWPDDRDRKQYKELKAQYEMLNEKSKAMMKK